MTVAEAGRVRHEGRASHTAAYARLATLSVAKLRR
jgi:hypothetical protein